MTLKSRVGVTNLANLRTTCRPTFAFDAHVSEVAVGILPYRLVRKN